MTFKNLAIGASLGMSIGLLGLPPAHANVILTYTGNDFFSLFPSGQTVYSTSDKVTATITLANPLANNTSNQYVIPIAYTLSDGVQTFTSLAAIPSSGFLFVTNAKGVITQWWVMANNADASFGVDTLNLPTISPPEVYDAGFYDGASGQVSGDPGHWTTTTTSEAVPAPEPSTLAVLGTLLGFFLLRFARAKRRERQIHPHPPATA